MTDRSRTTDQPEATAPDARKAGDDGPAPAPGGWTSRLDWQRVAAGVVLVLVSLYLLVAQGTAPPGSDTSLLSGPVGMAMNIAGIVAGAWVIWSAWRR